MRRLYIILLLILAGSPVMLHAENETSYLLDRNPSGRCRQAGPHGRADDVRGFEQGQNPHAAHRGADARARVGGRQPRNRLSPDCHRRQDPSQGLSEGATPRKRGTPAFSRRFVTGNHTPRQQEPTIRLRGCRALRAVDARRAGRAPRGGTRLHQLRRG